MNPDAPFFDLLSAVLPNFSPIGALAIVFITLALTGVLSSRLSISPILFFITFGMVLGPNAFNIVQDSSELQLLKQLGLIILLFLAGLDFNFDNLQGKLKNAVIIATPPAIVGFGLAFGLYWLTDWLNYLETLVLGLILTTTSISLSLSVLREKLGSDSEVYHTMVLAIILSNVVMILVAGLITRSIQSGAINFVEVFGNFFLVVIFIVIIVYLSKNVHHYWVERLLKSEDKEEEDRIKNQRMQFALGILGIVLLIAFLLRIDLAIASFFAGIYVSQTTRMQQSDMMKMNALGYGLMIPIFFFTMGMEVNISYFLNLSIIFQVTTILILSFIGQVTLTAVSSLMANFSLEESINLGIGLSACSLSGGFAVLSIGANSGEMASSTYSIFAAVITLSVLMTIIGLEIFNRVELDSENIEESVPFV